MLHISVIHQQRARTIDHESGPIEFGRVPQAHGVRVVLEDPFVSRDQMRLCETVDGRVAIENLSSKTLIALDDGSMIGAGERNELTLPLALNVGATRIEIRGDNGVATPAPTADSWQTILRPARREGARPLALNLEDSYEPLTPEQLAEWFETVISVQRSAAGSREFFDETARAVVELIGLDRAMVLLRRDDDWEIAASHSASPGKQPSYSRTILRRVVEEGRTFFRAVDFSSPAGSLMGVEAVVASPVFDAHNEEVVGAVYGLRTRSIAGRAPAIRPLEAQLVQVLAAAGAGLARQQHEADAARSRVQFEQFFSSALARELERDETLLDGRDREITVLFSDIRGFSSLSETLGPAETCRLVGDIMERLTTRIVEHEGVVVDYIGDGLLAMWNAPAEQPRHAELAARAALAMQAELPALNEQWESVVGRPLGLGIGVNTGAARVGNIGSRRRFKYGPLGHSVNLASRVESVTKQLGVPVLLTGSTHALLGDEFATRRLCRARVVGIAAPVDLYELHGQQVDDEWRRWRDTYEAALGQFEAGDWAEACQTIYPLLTGPDSRYDGPSLELVSRAIRCLKTPPEPFDPVVEFEEK